MNIKSTRRVSSLTRNTAVLALCAMSPIVAMAAPQSVNPSFTSSNNVPLSDLDLSTPDGQKMARERLRTTARYVCISVASGEDLSHQANFNACVEDTYAAALQKLNAAQVGRASSPNQPVGRNVPGASAGRSMSVSLADLDLLTSQGASAAHERIHAAARRLCSQVADSHAISHQPDFVSCVSETMAAAMRQLQTSQVAVVERFDVTQRTAP